MTTTERLVELLRDRMADEEVGADDPLAVAELHKRLLPYHTCRDRLGYATKAEYDVALLHLLADERRVAVAEPALREAVRSEIRQPEPGLGFLHRFAASEVRLKAALDVGDAVEDDADEAHGPDRGGRPAAAAVDTRAAPALRPDADAVCRKCAGSLPAVEGVRFCPNCGADQTVPTCTDCGADVEEAWTYCAFCGSLQ